MTEITQISQWQASAATSPVYERLLACLGTEGFGPEVRHSLFALTGGMHRLYLFEATGPEETDLQYFCGERGLAQIFPAYRKWYLPRDPVCEAYEAAPRCSDVVLQKVRPAAIASTGFRRRVFDDAGIIERVSVIQRGADTWRGMSVARHCSQGRFQDDELDALIGLAGIVLPMLPFNRRRRSAAQPLDVAELEQRFAARFPGIPNRERQVCARAAAGMSVEATARELGIAKTSVLTYRQRAYQRLQVASSLELCALATH